MHQLSQCAACWLFLTLTMLRCAAQSSICYAAPGGNRLNEGFSWRSSKGTVMDCYDALPPGGGTIYIGHGTPATAIAGEGIWIMGHTDPNYGNPPQGWRTAKTAVSFIGVGGQQNIFNGYANLAFVVAGGSADRRHPAVWISGSNAVLHFENLSFEYPGRGVVIGENSNFVRSVAGNGGSQGISFENVQVQTTGRSNGPAVDLTGGSFWLRFVRCAFSANSQAVSRTDDTGAAVLLDGKNGGGASADFEDISIAGSTPNGGGSLKDYPTPVTVSSLYVHGLQTEDLQDVPAIWLLPVEHGKSATYQSLVHISDVSLADSVGNTPAVRIDGENNPPENVMVEGLLYGYVTGSATVFGVTPANMYSTMRASPLSQGQRGTLNGRLVGQTDAARRGFSSTAARFPNLASQLVSTWKTVYSGNVSFSNVAAPDGTNNAGRVRSARGQSSAQFCTKETYQPHVGDWIIAGVWARAATNQGYYHDINPVQLSFQYATVSGGAGNGGYAILQAPWKGDGEWEWIWGAWKVLSSQRPGLMMLSGLVDENTATDFFAPILLDIPVGTVSDNEAWELALHLESYRDDALPGQVSLLRGEQFKADLIQLGNGPTIRSGVGAPMGTAETGSIYLRRDGKDGFTFYIFENGAWHSRF